MLFLIFSSLSLNTGQKEIISAVLSGQNSLAIFPTGGGKSLTYQLTATMLRKSGLTIIVSPLLALMKDQVEVALHLPIFQETSVSHMISMKQLISRLVGKEKLQVESLAKLGLQAQKLDSSLSPSEHYDVMSDLKAGKVNLLYVSPERFSNRSFADYIRQVRSDQYLDPRVCVRVSIHQSINLNK